MNVVTSKRPTGWMSSIVLAALALGAGCGRSEPDVGPSGAVARVSAPLLITPSLKTAPLTGPMRQSAALEYHGGRVITNTPKVYYIWYGDWSNDMATVSLLETFAQTLGGSSWYAINTTYANSCGQAVNGAVTFAGHIFDAGSQTNNISNLPAIVTNALTTGALPTDPDAVYFVLTAANVTEGNFCKAYCGYHSNEKVNGVQVHYAFVGNARTQCPPLCIVSGLTPNEPAADGMASMIAHELSESVTDPDIDAWRNFIHNANGTTTVEENGDECGAWFVPTYTTASGAPANLHLGTKDYLVQENRINGPNGMCANALTSANATCVNNVLDGAETDVDCGGACPGCTVGKRCATSLDCAGNWCSNGTCVNASCANQVKDGIESDVDCGELCPGCAVGKACTYDSDCQTHHCVSGRCVLPDHCANQVKDVDETDVDCGGTCGGCPTGKACNVAADCLNNGCNASTHLCVEHCADGQKDYDESDIDCGRYCSTSCSIGKRCASAVDCVNQAACFGGTCVDHCGDGRLDNGEADVDCGGGCGRCTAGKRCTVAADCASNRCVKGGGCTCTSAADCVGGAACTLGVCSNHCSDGLRNFDETDVDCGGSCAPCGENKACTLDLDCGSRPCHNGRCGCSTAADCAAGEACLLGDCYPQCSDGMKDGNESDVDCGGSCAPCGENKACTRYTDCQTYMCVNGRCGCMTAADCAAGEWCVNDNCYNHCADHIMDADETGLDCGGADCAACPICYGP
jgi:hypothetical protein